MSKPAALGCRLARAAVSAHAAVWTATHLAELALLRAEKCWLQGSELLKAGSLQGCGRQLPEASRSAGGSLIASLEAGLLDGAEPQSDDRVQPLLVHAWPEGSPPMNGAAELDAESLPGYCRPAPAVFLPDCELAGRARAPCARQQAAAAVAHCDREPSRQLLHVSSQTSFCLHLAEQRLQTWSGKHDRGAAQVCQSVRVAGRQSQSLPALARAAGPGSQIESCCD